VGKPSAPSPPDPFATAGAATATNVGTSVANAFLNNTNQNTPTGSLNYDQSGNYQWSDPNTGATYTIPRFTATTTLSPQEQAIQNQNQAAQLNLAGLGNAQSARLPGLLANSVNLGAAPAAGQASTIAGTPGPQTQIDTSGLANASNITKTYGDDPTFSQAGIQQALMGQLQPQLDIQKQQLQQQLADQGIGYGSTAYNNAFTPFNQQENNAWLQAVTGATQQRATEMGIQQQQAGFQNAAQGQAFQQAATQGQFANTAQQAQLQQAEAAFGAQNTARNQWLTEQYAAQNAPINQITSLLSGTQVSNPNFVNTPSNQIPTTDVAGLINNQFNQNMQVYQQQSQNYNSLMGGILGMVGGAAKLGASDRRLKDNINRIATVFAATPTGQKKQLPIYQYNFKADPTNTPHVGPMAQDVEQIDPSAVTEIGGIKHLDHRQVMGSILRAG
jgi:hypothetical protein